MLAKSELKMLAAKTKLLPAECNFVARDAIWKNRVDKEKTAARVWPSKWSFTVDTYHELLQELKHPESNVAARTRLPSKLRLPPITPIEELIKVEKSPMPYPVTTCRHIGWRSSKPEYKFEIYGPYARPKQCIYKQLKWPLDAIS